MPNRYSRGGATPSYPPTGEPKAPDLESLYLDQLLGGRSFPQENPPGAREGAQASANTFGYGTAPPQDWTPPAANQPPPGLIDQALQAAEQAYNSVLQQGSAAVGQMGQYAPDVGGMWNRAMGAIGRGQPQNPEYQLPPTPNPGDFPVPGGNTFVAPPDPRRQFNETPRRGV